MSTIKFIKVQPYDNGSIGSQTVAGIAKAVDYFPKTITNLATFKNSFVVFTAVFYAGMSNEIRPEDLEAIQTVAVCPQRSVAEMVFEDMVIDKTKGLSELKLLIDAHDNISDKDVWTAEGRGYINGLKTAHRIITKK